MTEYQKHIKKRLNECFDLPLPEFVATLLKMESPVHEFANSIERDAYVTILINFARLNFDQDEFETEYEKQKLV